MSEDGAVTLNRYGGGTCNRKRLRRRSV